MHLNLAYIAAVSAFESCEEVRPYLQGVDVQVKNDCIIYSASDGHRCLRIRQPLPAREQNKTFARFFIPTATSKAIRKSLRIKRGQYDHIYALLEPQEGWGFKLTFEQSWLFDGKHPGSEIDFDRLFPYDVEGAAGEGFNGAYLESFDRAGRLLGLGRPSFRQNGPGPALLLWADKDVCGLLMPFRDPSCGAMRSPAWARGEAAKTEAA